MNKKYHIGSVLEAATYAFSAFDRTAVFKNGYYGTNSEAERDEFQFNIDQGSALFTILDKQPDAVAANSNIDGQTAEQIGAAAVAAFLAEQRQLAAASANVVNVPEPGQRNQLSIMEVLQRNQDEADMADQQLLLADRLAAARKKANSETAEQPPLVKLEDFLPTAVTEAAGEVVTSDPAA